MLDQCRRVVGAPFPRTKPADEAPLMTQGRKETLS
jgi:hypothetical protein